MTQAVMGLDVQRKAFIQAFPERAQELLCMDRQQADAASDAAVAVKLLVLAGDIWRTRLASIPQLLDRWIDGLNRERVAAAIAVLHLAGPEGLLAHPEQADVGDDIGAYALNRDRLHSFAVALTRILQRRFFAVPAPEAQRLLKAIEAYDSWLGQALFIKRLDPVQVDVLRGDRILVETQPQWVLKVCYANRPHNPNGGTP